MTDNINIQTGNNSCQEEQMKNSNLIQTKEELYELSNDELINLYVFNGFKFGSIGKQINLGKESVRRLFIKRKIDYNNIKQIYKRKELEDYYKNPKYCKNCGKLIPFDRRINDFCDRSCSTSYNNKIYKKKNKSISTKPKKKKIIEITKKHNELLKTKYSKYNMPLINPGCCFICGEPNCENDFCKKHNFLRLMGFVEHLGFNSKTIGTIKVFEEFNRVRDMVYDLYWNKGLSLIDLGKKFNYSNKIGFMPTNVLDNLEIPRRSHSEATTNSILIGKKNFDFFNDSSFKANLVSEKHQSWTGETFFLRSSYEIDYANFLDNSKILYKVEYLKIKYFDSTKNRERIAIPDFYLPDTNEIIEIKSDFTLIIQEMLDKFKAYKEAGYSVKLILEHKEVDIYNIEQEIGKIRYNNIIKTEKYFK